MKIEARIDKMLSGDKVKAMASARLDSQYVVRGLRVIDGTKGLYVGYPQVAFKGKDGKTQYKDQFFPISNAGKMDLQEAVLKAYSQQLEQTQSNSHESGWAHQPNDGVLPFDLG